MKSLDELIQPYIDDHSAVGAAIAVLQNSQITYLGGFGKTCVEDHGIPVTPQTLFAYGSISKNFCAAVVMRLVEQGLLDLDQPVVEYLPGFQFSRKDFGNKVTLRHLLSHTSGLPMAGKYWGPRDPDSLGRFVYEQIPYYKFLAVPGRVHLYSNTVICIAGHVAEVVTGKYYEDLIQEYVFDPLEMIDSTFDPAIAMTYPLALPHKRNPDGTLKVEHRMTYNVSGSPSSFAYGSVTDLAHLAQMYLNQGNYHELQYLSPYSIDEMQKPHASRYIDEHIHPLANVNRGYGLGFNTGEYKGKRAARHGGMNLSFNCFFDLFPDDGAGVVILTNYSNDEPLLELVAALYDYALDLPYVGIVRSSRPAPISKPDNTHQLEDFSGSFLNVESGSLVRFKVIEDKLVIENRDNTIPLTQYSSHQFYAVITEKFIQLIAFIRNAEGILTHVMLSGNPYFPVVVDPSFHPRPDLWENYQGTYKDPTNRNMSDIFTVRIKDETLFIAEGDKEVPCSPITNRRFTSELGTIEFEDTRIEPIKILVWGLSTRFYPLAEEKFKDGKIIEYLVDVPTSS